jgi:hypothetical protein
MLYPFWGISNDADKSLGKFDKYISLGPNFFNLTPPDQADYAVFPMGYECVIENPSDKEKLEEFSIIASENGLKIVIFFFHDSYENIPIKNSIIFRPSFLKSIKNPNEYAMPAFCEDMVEKYCNGIMNFRKKNVKPTVGFMGYVAPLKRSLFFTIVRTINRKPLDLVNISPIRRRCIKELSKNEKIQKNFIMRNGFWGAIQSENEKAQQRIEYIKNIIDSDYTLCARGAGNFSFRFYETLSCCRIPLFINTDCALPFDDFIDWKKICVWIEENEIPEINEILLHYHTNILDREFLETQLMCRKIWKDYLTPEGFFQNVHNLLLMH